MGYAGTVILKTSLGFLKKGDSRSSQVQAQMQSKMQRLAEENARLAAGYERVLQHQRDMTTYNHALIDIQTRQNELSM